MRPRSLIRCIKSGESPILRFRAVRQELYIIFGIIALAAFILLLVYLGQG